MYRRDVIDMLLHKEMFCLLVKERSGVNVQRESSFWRFSLRLSLSCCSFNAFVCLYVSYKDITHCLWGCLVLGL